MTRIVLTFLFGVGAGLAALLLVQPARGQDIFVPSLASGNPVGYEREVSCMTQAIVYEAGFEPLEGQQAVAQVILNRAQSGAYPTSVCGVVYQGSTRRTGCQFTFTCDGSLARRMSPKVMGAARAIAEEALQGRLPDRVGNATHYHASYVSPYWAPSLRRIGRIGAHIFYSAGDFVRAPGATTSPIAPQRGTSNASRTEDRPFAPWGLMVAVESGISAVN